MAEVVLAAGEIKPAAALRIGLLPWASLGILVLTLLAQRSLEPVDGAPTRPWMLGAVLYGAGFLLLIWASWRNELKAAGHPVDEERC